MSGVGWYVHHHGHGHLTRFRAVRPHLAGPVVVFSSLAAPAHLPEDTTWVVLPRDDGRFVAGDREVDPRTADPTVGGMLHWAPLGHPGHRRRLTTIAQVSTERALDAFVVDVSVEVALWVRLLGLPAVVVTQPGERTDDAHALAYRAADRILAPWPEGMVASTALDAVRDKVTWVGGISRFAGRERTRTAVPGSVLVLGSVAEPGAVTAAVANAEAAGWRLQTVGGDASGWLDDPWDLLCASEVVISAAGQNSVADLAAAGSRAVVVPQERPFAEQLGTAAALAANGLAVVAPAWPGRDLPALLARARALRPDWTLWRTDGAPERAAGVIGSVAG
ncbi:glycosyltransferase [Microbacterium sp. P05]|uniref:glycosyltransferase n=1 Tax=Microbacterium sp. P05 TaxID=3366948 RepID=UPI0037477B2B